MNKIIFEIGSDGNLITLPNSNNTSIEMTQLSQERLNESSDEIQEPIGNFKRAKQFMRTPCGHRYHPVCLKKWMEVRLECPFCR